MSELVSIEAVWRDRAKIAAEAAEELADLADALVTVGSRNVFGIGCAEGQALFDRLRTLVDSGATTITSLSKEAATLAVTCRLAADAYVAVDDLSAEPR